VSLSTGLSGWWRSRGISTGLTTPVTAPASLLWEVSWRGSEEPGRGEPTLGIRRGGLSEEGPLRRGPAGLPDDPPRRSFWDDPVRGYDAAPSEEGAAVKPLGGVPRWERARGSSAGVALRRASSGEGEAGERPSGLRGALVGSPQGFRAAVTPRSLHLLDPETLDRPSEEGGKVSPALVARREERVFRGLSLIGNPYYLPAGFSRGAGADPLLSFHPSRVFTYPAMTGPRSCLLPCT